MLNRNSNVRYAGLYFCICVDVSDNNLYYLEVKKAKKKLLWICYLQAIHNFVEVLNEYFHNVCELDLVFNFYKVLKIFWEEVLVLNPTFVDT